jgi:hypothetical protein
MNNEYVGQRRQRRNNNEYTGRCRRRPTDSLLIRYRSVIVPLLIRY